MGNEGTVNYSVPDDCHMEKLYCRLNNIGEDVPIDEVHKRMAQSHDALVTVYGDFIRFADYANSLTTLSQRGFRSDIQGIT